MAEKKSYLFGIDTFGDVPSREDGTIMSHAESLRQVVSEAVLADKLGIDVIALGEHHRPDYSISSPETVLAGIATVTKNITLASGVTVLSSDDPVRVFQRFATVDALSNGRAQVILGRGSFTESFPLFGYDLTDYNTLFEEKIDLFHKLLDENPVSWEGTTRAALDKADVYPKTESGRLDTMVGVGGSPESIIRAARYGFPVVLAIIGGAPKRFAPYVDLYDRATKELGTTRHPIAVHSPGFVAETDKEARDIVWPSFKANRDNIGKDRGWPPLTREQYEHDIEHGSLYIGSPETVAQKIAKTMTTLSAERFDIVYGSGTLGGHHRLKFIELYGKQVIPRVKELLAERDKVKK